MNNQKEQLDAINDIKKLMERSSKFSALSGLSGIIVGNMALVCIGISYTILGITPLEPISYLSILNRDGAIDTELLKLLIINFSVVLLASFLTAIWLSNKNAVKKGEQIWDLTAKRMLINFSIPMFAGGAYCFILFTQNHIELILPATLLFYGLALLNASKYTVEDIKYLGVLLVLLGLFASIYVDEALLLWGIGFGALHIVYGSFMYFKYEK
ncbi:MAG TPA: hypothetical protein VJA82_13705 [Sediminibacterium sp.]|uniref:hypothetical protein n=1 Tax=Sediminibacterium sp. TaxID=1917865 RepID=UPI0008C35363|nr:hypothetical protein [Sediminibacterium sp.]OHC86232.1 MAG: hypothetical protein A2472_01270 [Sphingobacteriia bacterium RIFOXYC2_FULL_35_18]OHC89745.1 MAG: hypothetical protein A2546_10515 [Sphingobacteriia bacterium RIFOXYD2_FULL_35_12]HLD54359.1 hypothetical protein [Sediminibacterium sp.]